ncbi:tetratricopeptide repeat protein [Patulibacter minatonensis]|uniref:tetratricopeptide repeat protein n=1 Tax=Patulibacter minatonensis TaxID=298163 RepID=UPI0012FBB889|nr:tetratricopeptide repeat protein [Patulibacter minatonensis]
MPTWSPRTRELAAPAGVVLVLLLVAAALVPSLRDERRLDHAQDLLRTAPGRALVASEDAESGTTRSRVEALRVTALVRLGDLRGAERLARAVLRRDPSDVLTLRRLYQVQLLRKRTGAAARTKRELRRLDPKYADGTGV